MAGLLQGPLDALLGEQWYIRGCQNSLESGLEDGYSSRARRPRYFLRETYGQTMVVGGSTVKSDIHTSVHYSLTM